MGPAWFWSGQPRIAALIKRLGLEQFDQVFEGDLIYEDETGQIQRGRGHASMQGSYRLKGGLQALTDALQREVPDPRKKTGTQLTSLVRETHGVSSILSNGERIFAQHVVLAIPPRIAADTITFAPPLPDPSMQAMRSIPTWMAGQAKAIATYQTPFWRDAGLSGDAMSRIGPMVEIHDASPHEGGPYALFGFIGIPPEARTNTADVESQVIAQFSRLFGAQAASPTALYYKDWAADPFTATQRDQAPLYAHPRYGLPRELTGLWDDQLHFAGTEVAPQFGGFLEGALEAAENALSRLQL